MKKLSQRLTYWLGVTAVGLILGLSIQFVQAWTESGAAPPGGNVGAPINTSDFTQTKMGNISLNKSGTWANGLIVENGNAVFNGNVGIGTAGPNTKLSITNGNSYTNIGELSSGGTYSGIAFGASSAAVTT